MSTTNSLTNFKITDRQKVVGKITAGGILVGLGLMAYWYILPFLNDIVWGTVELVTGIGIAVILFWILTSKKFWLGLELLGRAIGKVLFGFIIELDPFNVLEMKVDEAEKDRESLRRETEKLKGQEAELKAQIEGNDVEMKMAASKIKILKERLQKNPGNTDDILSLEEVSTQYSLAKDFIDGVAPIYNDIKKLTVFADKIYKKSGTDIAISKQTIAKQRQMYRAVTTASRAFSKAMSAFAGKKELNDAGEIALQKLREDIGLKIGRIKSSIDVTSQFMNQRDLTDAAKVQQAVETFEKLDNDKNFSYAETISTTTAIGSGNENFNANVATGNKYISFLKKEK